MTSRSSSPDASPRAGNIHLLRKARGRAPWPFLLQTNEVPDICPFIPQFSCGKVGPAAERPAGGRLNRHRSILSSYISELYEDPACTSAGPVLASASAAALLPCTAFPHHQSRGAFAADSSRFGRSKDVIEVNWQSRRTAEERESHEHHGAVDF